MYRLMYNGIDREAGASVIAGLLHLGTYTHVYREKDNLHCDTESQNHWTNTNTSTALCKCPETT